MSGKKVMESFFGIKNFKTVLESFFSIHNFKSRKKVKDPFFRICFLKKKLFSFSKYF